MRETQKMILVLLIICGIAGLVLSGLKTVTAPKIESQILTYVQEPAIKRIFVNYDNNPILERQKFILIDDKEVTVFPIKNAGVLNAVALENFAKGYSGNIGVMVGIELKKNYLVGVSITTMSETPGIGTLITEPNFIKQFINILPEVELRSKQGSIDAVSGASISSGAVVVAVQLAVKDYLELKSKILDAWQE